MPSYAGDAGRPLIWTDSSSCTVRRMISTIGSPGWHRSVTEGGLDGCSGSIHGTWARPDTAVATASRTLSVELFFCSLFEDSKAGAFPRRGLGVPSDWRIARSRRKSAESTSPSPYNGDGRAFEQSSDPVVSCLLQQWDRICSLILRLLEVVDMMIGR